MSGVILFGVLRMPYELAMSSELSRMQFYLRVQQACDELEASRSSSRDRAEALEEAAKVCDAGHIYGPSEQGNRVIVSPSHELARVIRALLNQPQEG